MDLGGVTLEILSMYTIELFFLSLSRENHRIELLLKSLNDNLTVPYTCELRVYVIYCLLTRKAIAAYMLRYLR